MKDKLTPEQSQSLIELGVDSVNASETYVGRWEVYSTGTFADPSSCEPLFTLSDILSLLPKEINGYPLLIFAKRFFEETDEVAEGWTVLYTNNDLTAAFGDKGIYSAPELIDALFELLVWCITNKHLKL